MSKRFGGAYSPDSDPRPTQAQTSPLAGRRPRRGRARINVLFYVALPLIFMSLRAPAVEMAQNFVAFALIALAVWLTREGLSAQEAYEARTVARRPAIPRKIFGAVAMGLGVALATLDGGILGSAIYGTIATVLHLVSFGTDPMRDKTIEGVDTFQTDRVARAVEEAERHLDAMSQAIKTAGDRVMIARVDQFQATARAMFRTVEEDPRDLSASRRYLGVYLLGAKDATVKFAKLYAKDHDPSVKADYTALLDDLEANFTAKNQALLSDNRTDLDIEIDVLRDRLQREGIRLPQGE